MKALPGAFLFMVLAMAGTQEAVAQRSGRDQDRDRDDREEVYRDRDDRDVYREGRSSRRDGDYERRRGVLDRVLGGSPRRAHVPKGHYPPPGECRVWYPDRPAGHQPPPESCSSARRRALGGAFVLYGDEAYDMDYDWERDRVRRRSLPETIIDILRYR